MITHGQVQQIRDLEGPGKGRDVHIIPMLLRVSCRRIGETEDQQSPSYCHQYWYSLV